MKIMHGFARHLGSEVLEEMVSVDKEHPGNFYEVFEVFSKRTHKGDFQHQFNLLAPNHEMAFIMAQENFMRREPVVDLWIV